MVLNDLYQKLVSKRRKQSIVFNGDKILQDVGRWLGIIGGKHLDIDYKTQDKISSQFGCLLRSIGITEDVILCDYKADRKTILAFEIGNGCINRFEIFLVWECDYGHTGIIIDNERRSWIYTLNSSFITKSPFFVLDSYIKTNRENGNTLYGFLKINSFVLDLQNNDDACSIKVESNNGLHPFLNSLLSSFDIDSYLLGISLSSCDIKEIYRAFRLDGLSDCQFQITLYRNGDVVDVLEKKGKILERTRNKSSEE